MEKYLKSVEPSCPICEVSNLVPSKYAAEIEFSESILEVSNLECYLCPFCGADSVFPEQARRNHVKYEAAKGRLGTGKR